MAQHLYLVRHAEAIPRGTLEPDVNRWLTERGRRRFYKAARRFARDVGRGSGCAIEAILTSPAPRAVMTAELLGRALRFEGPVEVVPEGLAPGADVGPAAERLRGEARIVCAVGHEPLLGLLLRALCDGGEPDEGLPEGLPEGLKKGAIAHLRTRKDEPRARLRSVREP